MKICKVSDTVTYQTINTPQSTLIEMFNDTRNPNDLLKEQIKMETMRDLLVDAPINGIEKHRKTYDFHRSLPVINMENLSLVPVCTKHSSKLILLIQWDKGYEGVEVGDPNVPKPFKLLSDRDIPWRFPIITPNGIGYTYSQPPSDQTPIYNEMVKDTKLMGSYGHLGYTEFSDISIENGSKCRRLRSGEINLYTILSELNKFRDTITDKELKRLVHIDNVYLGLPRQLGLVSLNINETRDSIDQVYNLYNQQVNNLVNKTFKSLKQFEVFSNEPLSLFGKYLFHSGTNTVSSINALDVTIDPDVPDGIIVFKHKEGHRGRYNLSIDSLEFEAQLIYDKRSDEPIMSVALDVESIRKLIGEATTKVIGELPAEDTQLRSDNLDLKDEVKELKVKLEKSETSIRVARNATAKSTNKVIEQDREITKETEEMKFKTEKLKNQTVQSTSSSSAEREEWKTLGTTIGIAGVVAVSAVKVLPLIGLTGGFMASKGIVDWLTILSNKSGFIGSVVTGTLTVVKKIHEVISAGVGFISSIFTKVKEVVMTTWEWIKEKAANVIDWVKSKLTSGWDWVCEKVSDMKELVIKGWDKVCSWVETAGDYTFSVIETCTEFVSDCWNSVTNLASDCMEGCCDWVGGLFSW